MWGRGFSIKVFTQYAVASLPGALALIVGGSGPAPASKPLAEREVCMKTAGKGSTCSWWRSRASQLSS
jgi:hypothetical protein